MDEILKRDQNSAVVLGGVTDDSNQFIRMLRVDPVTGRLLVSGTGGGGGLTEITMTGAVNGSNVTFNASNTPTYIVSDGAWYKRLDNNGNPQWSISGLTVTMIIPPSASIYAF